MKRKKVLYMILISVLFMTSCMFNSKEDFSKEEKKVENGEKVRFNMDIGLNVVTNYMEAFVNEDTETMLSLYTAELKENKEIKLPKSLKCKSYKIEDISQIGDKGSFLVKASFTDMATPLAILEKLKIIVVREEDTYKINKVIRSQDKEIFSEGTTLRVRNEDEVKTELLLDESSIPEYTGTTDDKTSNYKIKTPDERVNSVNISYIGDKAIIVKGEEDSYVALINIDYTVPAQAQPEGEQGSGGEQGGGKAPAREVPIGKKIISLDYLIGTQVQYAVFSLDEEFVLLQLNKPDQGRSIKLYDTMKGELIKLELDKKFPLDKVELVYVSLEEGIITFEVVAKDMKEIVDNKMLGIWEINLKTKELSKI